MNYVKEEDNWIFAEFPECNMIMKFKKYIDCKNQLNVFAVK